MKQFFCVLILLFCSVLVAEPEASDSIRFCSYNLKNFQIPSDSSPDKRAKPMAEIDSVVKVLSEIKPDVLGLCEMGSEASLTYLQNRLSEVGIHLPYHFKISGIDQNRHLAVLSRFPLLSHSPDQVPLYQIGEKVYGMSRNVLDVEVSVSQEFTFRLIGCHLKSRREVAEGPQEWMRRNEAHIVRSHLLSILESDPKTYVLLYGDFNEYKNHASIHEIEGKKGHLSYFKPLVLRDTHGHTWTHYWKDADIYSRFDYIFLSQTMSKAVNLIQTRIHDSLEVPLASDHRPLVVEFQIRK